ncbi:hypothetical protein B0J12DRAFT_98686 [Macrophomina phaseolina]|uniref:Uncharacterized protein n=1 Tax=Macrophomina phaseolina TaxID=35725 RepID=A0ABQ8G9H7_9PEZI|nr:hypothetical protein B0J12DRAFT_98686 [Macrophomina phaseolina]
MMTRRKAGNRVGGQPTQNKDLWTKPLARASLSTAISLTVAFCSSASVLFPSHLYPVSSITWYYCYSITNPSFFCRRFHRHQHTRRQLVHAMETWGKPPRDGPLLDETDGERQFAHRPPTGACRPCGRSQIRPEHFYFFHSRREGVASSGWLHKRYRPLFSFCPSAVPLPI